MGDGRADYELWLAISVRMVCPCQAAGMASLGRVALDGPTARANASKRKAMSYARMTEARDAALL